MLWTIAGGSISLIVDTLESASLLGDKQLMNGVLRRLPASLEKSESSLMPSADCGIRLYEFIIARTKDYRSGRQQYSGTVRKIW